VAVQVDEGRAVPVRGAERLRLPATVEGPLPGGAGALVRPGEGHGIGAAAAGLQEHRALRAPPVRVVVAHADAAVVGHGHRVAGPAQVDGGRLGAPAGALVDVDAGARVHEAEVAGTRVPVVALGVVRALTGAVVGVAEPAGVAEGHDADRELRATAVRGRLAARAALRRRVGARVLVAGVHRAGVPVVAVPAEDALAALRPDVPTGVAGAVVRGARDAVVAIRVFVAGAGFRVIGALLVRATVGDVTVQEHAAVAVLLAAPSGDAGGVVGPATVDVRLVAVLDVVEAGAPLQHLDHLVDVRGHRPVPDVGTHEAAVDLVTGVGAGALLAVLDLELVGQHPAAHQDALDEARVEVEDRSAAHAGARVQAGLEARAPGGPLDRRSPGDLQGQAEVAAHRADGGAVRERAAGAQGEGHATRDGPVEFDDSKIQSIRQIPGGLVAHRQDLVAGVDVVRGDRGVHRLPLLGGEPEHDLDVRAAPAARAVRGGHQRIRPHEEARAERSARLPREALAGAQGLVDGVRDLA